MNDSIRDRDRDLAAPFRQIPPWRNRIARVVSLALAILVVIWAAFAALGAVLERMAPELPGRVLGVKERYSKKGTLEYRIDYQFTDERGQVHRDYRDLVVDRAR